ncbi:hypothetical protein Esti_006065 [Eimeria stiedai]
MHLFPRFPSGTYAGGGRRADPRARWTLRFIAILALVLISLCIQVLNFPAEASDIPILEDASLLNDPDYTAAESGSKTDVGEKANWGVQAGGSGESHFPPQSAAASEQGAASGSDVASVDPPAPTQPQSGTTNAPKDSAGSTEAEASGEGKDPPDLLQSTRRYQRPYSPRPEETKPPTSGAAHPGEAGAQQPSNQTLPEPSSSAAAEAHPAQSSDSAITPASPEPSPTSSETGTTTDETNGPVVTPDAKPTTPPPGQALPSDEFPPPPPDSPEAGTTTDETNRPVVTPKAEPTTPPAGQALPSDEFPPPPPEFPEPFDDEANTSGVPPPAGAEPPMTSGQPGVPSGDSNAPNPQPPNSPAEPSTANADDEASLPPPPPSAPPLEPPPATAGPPMSSGESPAPSGESAVANGDSSSSPTGPSPPSPESSMGTEPSAPLAGGPPTQTGGPPTKQEEVQQQGVPSTPPPSTPQPSESGSSSEPQTSDSSFNAPLVTPSPPKESASIKSGILSPGDSLEDRATNCAELLVPFTGERTRQLDAQVRSLRSNSSATRLRNFEGYFAKPTEILTALDEGQLISPSLANLYYEYLKNHKDKWRRTNPRWVLMKVPETTVLILPSSIFKAPDGESNAVETTLAKLFAHWNFRRLKTSSVVVVWEMQVKIFGVTLVDFKVKAQSQVKATLRTYSPVVSTDTHLSPSLFKVLTDRFQQAGACDDHRDK